MSQGAQNTKMGLTPSVPPKKSTRAQNMKTGPNALRTAENVSGSAKHENGTKDAVGTAENEFGGRKHENETRRPRYRWKWVPERKTWKLELTPTVPPKTSPGAQNLKTRTNALGIAKNVSGSAELENETRRRRYSRKWVRARKTWKLDTTPSEPPKMSPGAQNMKTGPDALTNFSSNLILMHYKLLFKQVVWDFHHFWPHNYR
jgi:hypothetical protein